MRFLPSLNPTRKRILLSTWGLFAGLSLLLVTAGLFSTMVGIRAELKQLPTIVSGGITTAYYAGFLLGSWYTLRALAQVGHIRVYAALASLLSASVLVSGVFDSPIVWIIMRVSTGFCYAGLYVVAESWLNGLATNTFRGRLLAMYNVVTIGAYGAGQLLVFNFDARTLTGFAFAAVVSSLAVIPVVMSEQAATPNVDNHTHITMRELAKIVPTGAGTILLVGLAHGGMLGMARSGIASRAKPIINPVCTMRLNLPAHSVWTERRSQPISTCSLISCSCAASKPLPVLVGARGVSFTACSPFLR